MARRRDLAARVPTVLTHCNAGALATAGIGTALGIVRALAARGADRGPRGRDAAVPAGRAPDGLGAHAGRPARHASPGRRRGRRSSRAGASTRSSSARTGSRRTATSRTRSGRTGSPSRAARTAFPFVVAAPTTTLDPATARRRRDPDRGSATETRSSTSPCRRAAGCPDRPGRGVGALPGLRRHAGGARRRDRHRARRSPSRRTSRALARLLAPR